METSTLREKHHALIDSSPKEKLVEVYSAFENSYTDRDVSLQHRDWIRREFKKQQGPGYDELKNEQ